MNYGNSVMVGINMTLDELMEAFNLMGCKVGKLPGLPLGANLMAM